MNTDVQELRDVLAEVAGRQYKDGDTRVRDLLGAPVGKATVRKDAQNFAALMDAGRLVCRAWRGGEILQVEKDMPNAVRELRSAADSDSGQVEVDVAVSSDRLDWYGDSVRQDGLDNGPAFDSNPVVLVDHEYTVASIAGRAVKSWSAQREYQTTKGVDGDGLPQQETLTLERHLLDPAADNPVAAMVGARLEAKSLRTTSIGFMPVEFTRLVDDEGNDTDGFDFLRSAHLETSWVPVPAQPSATILHLNASKGRSPAPSPDSHGATLDTDLAAMMETYALALRLRGNWRTD